MAKRPEPLQMLEDPPQGALASQPFRMGLLEDRLGIHLRFAQNQLFREVTQVLAAFDFTPLLFSIMVLVESNPNCRQSDLGAALAVKQSNLVERIDLLVGRGLVTRVQDPADRRANVLALTPKGRRLLAELKAADEAINQLFIDRLGPEDHALLVALLKRLIPVGE